MPCQIMWRRILKLLGFLLIISLLLLHLFQHPPQTAKTTNAALVTEKAFANTTTRGKTGRVSLESRDRVTLPANIQKGEEILPHGVTAVLDTGQCVPNYNVFYLKVHKTGSSTVSTMLERLVLRRQLRMLLVNRTPYPYSDLHKFILELPQQNRSSPYNVYCDHVVFDEGEAAAYMSPDTAYIATLRYPLAQLRSAFNEFAIAKVLGLNKTGDIVREFFVNIEKYKDQRPYLRGIMSNSFGLHPTQMKNTTAVNELINTIDKKFVLVMMMDYFKESLVMLRRKLCWDMEDIVYTMQRFNAAKHIRQHILPAELQEIHQNYNMPEYKLFDHFNFKFLQMLSGEKNFAEEVDTYKRILENVASFCQMVVTRLAADTNSVYKMASETDNVITLNPAPWGKEFTLHALDCAVMRMDTVILRNVIKINQLPELCTSPDIERMFVNGSLYMDIQLKRNKVEIHPTYCEPNHPLVQMPLAVMAEKTAYMWLGSAPVVTV